MVAILKLRHIITPDNKQNPSNMFELGNSPISLITQVSRERRDQRQYLILSLRVNLKSHQNDPKINHIQLITYALVPNKKKIYETSFFMLISIIDKESN